MLAPELDAAGRVELVELVEPTSCSLRAVERVERHLVLAAERGWS